MVLDFLAQLVYVLLMVSIGLFVAIAIISSRR